MTAAAGTGAARVLRAAGTALPAGLGLAAAAGAIALLVHPDGWTVLTVPAGLALAALAWLRPVAAVALLLALSPICGHRPTTGPFVAFVALTACAVPGWLARLWTRDRARGAGRAGDADRPGADGLRRRVRPQPEQPAALRARRHRRRRHRRRGDPRCCPARSPPPTSPP